jgi:hypothetical protein
VPKYQTRTDMKAERLATLMKDQDLSYINSNPDQKLSAQTRIQIKDDARAAFMLNKPSKKVENETKTILLHKRREKAVQENMEKFGNVAIGIHGIELPKFSDPGFES